MDIYNVGTEEINEDDIVSENLKFIVYWYESGYYEGDGEAVILTNDNVLYYKSLGHCSCYGPMDGGILSGVEITLDELLSDKDSIHSFDCDERIKNKVRELV